ncbi:MAG: S9 family peptidase [Acidobacteria bacterium]|nr:MAG: S9 family peptidase [Acidobacteriota bacterium]
MARSADGAVLPEPPMAKRVPHVTEIHGETLVDPYYWLRERDNPDVLAYLEAENAYTEQVMKHTEGLQQALYEEMVGRIKETDLSVPVRRGPYYYYSRTEKGKQYRIYCRKKGSLEAPEEILLDVNQLAEGHDFYRLGVFEVSPDHRLLAYAFDVAGSEDYHLRFKDLESGELLADEIPAVAYSFEWGNDNRTVFYTTRDEARRQDRVHRHVLGSDAADDQEIFHEADERFDVYVSKTRSQSYLIIASTSSTTSEMRLLAADRPAGDFILFRPRQQGIEYYVDHHGDHFYVYTNEEAKNYKLMRTPVADVSRASWQEVIPHRPEVKLEFPQIFARHMVISERVNGLRRMRVRDFAGGAERPIEMPESVYAVFAADNPEFDTDVFRFQYTSPITPRSVFEYDMATGERTLLKQDEVKGYDPTRYETQRLYARARDGIAVPVVLLYRKGLERNGENPCMLYGYGSYGASLDPFFSPTRLSLVDRGFVFALANVRGGGELGEAWHDDGKMLKKMNTFTDFIDVAEFLIDQRYTKPDKLVIEGGSAGGLLMGAVVNMRPDLFHAVVARVPFVDVVNTMLDESIPLTVGEFEEWGNPKDEEYFRYILSYSPYDNVKAQDYPHMLITTGLNDSRVQYWEPAKWTAKLRATKTDRNRLLLKTNMGAGHGGASGRYDAFREQAFVYAFILDSVGITG